MTYQMDNFLKNQQITNYEQFIYGQTQQPIDQNAAYLLMNAQLVQQATMNHIPYPQIIQANPINCCCAETFNKLNTTCAEREQIIEYNLKSCVQAYPKVILEKTTQEDKKGQESFNLLKICCVLLAVISRFISHFTSHFFFPLLMLLNLILNASIIVLLLGICSLEKNQ